MMWHLFVITNIEVVTDFSTKLTIDTLLLYWSALDAVRGKGLIEK